MVDIQSKEVIDKISEDLKVQPSLSIPRELMKQIQLSYNVNPDRMIQIKEGTVSDSATGTIFTTSATKDTFLIGANLTVAKDVNSDSLNTRIQVIPFGLSVGLGLIRIRHEPLTAGSFTQILTLPMPLKLARGSGLTMNTSSATPSIDISGVIYFFEVDPL